MTEGLHELIDEAAAERAQRISHARLRRLLGMLEFEPQIDPRAIHAAVDEELADQRQRGIAAVAPLLARPATAAAARAVHERLAATAAAADNFPRDELARLAAGAPAAVASAIGEIIERYDRFAERLGWLLRPTTAADVQRLDPVRDAQQIYHHISYDFRVEQKIFAILFELRGVGAPYASLMFHSTGEYTLRGLRRNNETFMMFSNLFEWGLDSKRGRDVMARVNQIHGRYALHNAGFLYTLGGIMFVPELWNRKLGWRRFTEIERHGWFHAFVEMGRAMGIQGLTGDYDEMFRLWDETSRAQFATSTVGRKVFDEVTVQMLASYPPELRAPFLSAFVAGMDDLLRDTLGLPAPPADVVEQARAAFRLIGETQAAMPRVPWLRSLQLHPLYARTETLGVAGRSPHMPRPAGGDGAQVAPLAALPIISLDELARHDGDRDAWIAIDGIVYDVTRFLYEHPGGRAVLAKQLGRDATEAFRRVGHTAGAEVSLLNFRVARLAPSPAGAEPPQPAPAPARRIYNRRPSEGRAWTRQDWDAMVAGALHYTAAYEQALRRPDRDPDLFPIVLPHDLRGQVERPEAIVRPPESSQQADDAE